MADITSNMDAINFVVVSAWIDESSPASLSGQSLTISFVLDNRDNNICNRSCRFLLPTVIVVVVVVPASRGGVIVVVVVVGVVVVVVVDAEPPDRDFVLLPPDNIECRWLVSWLVG